MGDNKNMDNKKEIRRLQKIIIKNKKEIRRLQKIIIKNKKDKSELFFNLIILLSLLATWGFAKLKW